MGGGERLMDVRVEGIKLMVSVYHVFVIYHVR